MDPTTRILSIFEQISAIPRGTKNEAGLRAWIRQWAESLGLPQAEDAAGNLVVRVPASTGYEDRPILILQSHLDMVCEKTPDSRHDFLRDPIRLLQEGDWLTADRTTLGADNGIGVALMLALSAEETLHRPPLELLFTVEEERGLTGANNLDPALITGKTLINLDTEQEGVLTIGGAGGCVVTITLPVAWEPVGPGVAVLDLSVGGLRGGHSGDDIHKHRANANKLLARVLDGILRVSNFRLAALKGGSAGNAIPRDASAILVCSAEDAGSLQAAFDGLAADIRAEHARTEPDLSLSLAPRQTAPALASGLADTQKAVHLLQALPNGVAAFSAEIPGFVETSNNLGIVELREQGFVFVSSHRSGVLTRLEESLQQAEAVAWLAECTTVRTKINPPWTPKPDSPLLNRCVQTYTALFGQAPEVKLIHAGLECGILSNRCGGLDAVSLGPTVKNPHSPDERLFVPSLAKVWDYLRGLLTA